MSKINHIVLFWIGTCFWCMPINGDSQINADNPVVLLKSIPLENSYWELSEIGPFFLNGHPDVSLKYGATLDSEKANALLRQCFGYHFDAVWPRLPKHAIMRYAGLKPVKANENAGMVGVVSITLNSKQQALEYAKNLRVSAQRNFFAIGAAKNVIYISGKTINIWTDTYSGVEMISATSTDWMFIESKEVKELKIKMLPWLGDKLY